MIVVFGSINVDLVIRTETLPRPGETVLAPSYCAVAGGKGANQAVAAARAGAPVRMVGRVGDDGFAALALAELAAAGVDLSAVARDRAPTGCAMVCVDARGENQIAVASGANRAVSADQLDDAWLEPGATLVLQHEIDPAPTLAAAQRGRARGARVVLNAAPAAPLPEALPLDLLVMNAGEAAAIAAAAGLPAGPPEALARALHAGRGASVVVTLGAAGALAAADGGLWRVGTPAVEAVDTTAAGDAFVGVLAAALDDGATLAEALHRASVAGALACTVVGAQPALPSAEAIAAALPEVAPPVRA